MAVEKVVDLGPLTTYDYAVEGGYQGTEEEYAEYMATITDVIDEAEQSAKDASASATQAGASATAAASSASDSADSASASASSASAASGSASSASQSASNASASALASAASASDSEASAQASAALASAADTSAKAAASSAESAAGSATNAAGSAASATVSSTSAAGSATNAAASATSATGSARDSEAWAVGQRGGVDVESDDETYENNAKYYAEQAGSSATSAAGSATSAASSAASVASSAAQITKNANDITDLKSALSDVEAGYTPLGKLIPNSYITTIGGVAPYNGWSATDYIPINDSKRRLIITTPNSNGGNYDAFYNESKTFIAGSAFGLSKGENLIVAPENAKYVRLSNVTADLQQTTIKWWIANAAEIGSNAAFVYTTTGEDCVNASIDINGNAINADNWKATPYICVPFSNGGTIKVKSTINGNAGIAFYDKNQRCIYAITGNNASDYGITQNAYPVSRTIQVPANTFYIRFAVYLNGYGTVSDLYASDYGMNQLLFAIGEDNQSIMHFNEGVLPTVNASANYGYHKGGYYNTDTRFCLLVTTDPHGQKIQLERAVDYLNRMPCFTCGVTLGDIQAANFADNDGTWYTDVIKNANKNWLTIVGNHDAGHNNDLSLVGTPEAVYKKFIEPNMQYAGTTDTGKSYYYKDVDNYKIRLICLNDYDYTNNEIVNGVYVVPRYTEYFSQNQIDWLISTLSSTPAEYTVLVLLHNCPGRATKNTNIKFNNSVATWYYESTQNGIITDVVDAWQNGSTLAQTYICSNTNLPNVTVSADFTSRGSGLFAGFLCGHAHADNVGTIVAHPAQNVFTFSATAKGYYQNSDDDLPRQDGTKAADCITAFAIDTVHKNVLITRIGSDVSNILAKREPSVISYS